jgi:hypothetical protein
LRVLYIIYAFYAFIHIFFLRCIEKNFQNYLLRTVLHFMHTHTLTHTHTYVTCKKSVITMEDISSLLISSTLCVKKIFFFFFTCSRHKFIMTHV